MDLREIHALTAWMRARWNQQRAYIAANRDRGDIVQTAIMIGLFAAGAIIVVGILVATATRAAKSVQTQ
jgi:cytochrome c biogenesis protein CcdA